MSKRYGLSYQGSKNKLADWVLSHLPKAAHLYDLFAGGCAISHAALLSGKYGCVHFSDINDSVVLFRDCLEGNLPDGSEWISREEFYKRKDTDPYVRLVWSFGNNQRDYLYSREIEPYKKAVHEMIFATTPNERRLKFREVCKLMPTVWGKDYETICQIPNETARNNIRKAIDHESTERSQQITPPHEGIYNTQKVIRGSVSTPIQRGLTPHISKLQARINGENRGGQNDCSLRNDGQKSQKVPFVVGSMKCA